MYDLDYAKLCVGPGWHPLLDLLFAALPPDTVVTQVKEKFGGLRFYTGPSSAEYLDLVTDVEKLSFSICENCGRVGRPREGGWIRTLCDECACG